MNNIITLIIMAVAFYGYVIWEHLTYGIQSSISQTYYVLPKNQKIILYLSVLIYAVGGFIFYNHILTFLMMSGLIFSSTAPAFRDNKMEGAVHTIGANLAMVCSQIFIAAVLDQTSTVIATLTALLALEYLPWFLGVEIKNKTTWIEIIIFTSIMTAFSIHLLNL